jgi:hypothetical protein
MPYKNPNDPRKKASLKRSSAKYYQTNKTERLASAKTQKRNKRKEWSEYKGTLKCLHCGANHPAIIDFHHVVRDGTKRSVNELVTMGAYAAAHEEIKKCVPLCANCHRIHHYEERHKKRNKKKKNPAL